MTNALMITSTLWPAAAGTAKREEKNSLAGQPKHTTAIARTRGLHMAVRLTWWWAKRRWRVTQRTYRREQQRGRGATAAVTSRAWACNGEKVSQDLKQEEDRLGQENKNKNKMPTRTRTEQEQGKRTKNKEKEQDQDQETRKRRRKQGRKKKKRRKKKPSLFGDQPRCWFDLSCEANQRVKSTRPAYVGAGWIRYPSDDYALAHKFCFVTPAATTPV
jgi:hypothetical protein